MYKPQQQPQMSGEEVTHLKYQLKACRCSRELTKRPQLSMLSSSVLVLTTFGNSHIGRAPRNLSGTLHYNFSGLGRLGIPSLREGFRLG
jgi:hypothetical protein